jgi:DNA-directed RNA polymerase specialized sigma24 family protein
MGGSAVPGAFVSRRGAGSQRWAEDEHVVRSHDAEAALRREGAGARMSASGLTREGLEALLALLDPDRERAAVKYQEIRHRLVKMFECRGVLPPEEPADETMDRVARRLAEGEQVRVSEPSAYFYGVARNVLREHWARQRDRPVGLLPGHDRPSLDPGGAEQAGEGEARFRCLEDCLAALPPEMGRVITVYYVQAGAGKIARRKELAAQLGISTDALWARAHRIRARLEQCVRECMLARSASKRPGLPRVDEGASDA